MLEYRSRLELMLRWLSFVPVHPFGDPPREYGGVPASQWEALMPGYVACVDEPTSIYWKPLSEAFPKALVVLSLRDPDFWCASVRGLMDQLDEESKKPDSISAERRESVDFMDAIYATRFGQPSSTNRGAIVKYAWRYSPRSRSGA